MDSKGLSDENGVEGTRPRAHSQEFLRVAAASLGIIAVLACAAGLTYAALGTSHDTNLSVLSPQLVTRRPAPDFALDDRHGRTHRLSDFAGRPILLNFWSAECPPCVQEMPSLELLARTARERGTFTVITVTVNESWAEVSHLFPNGTDLMVLFDPDTTVTAGSYGTEMYPETFFIDGDGYVRARFDGQRDWAAQGVAELLESL